jgi:hypothetical protein
MPPRWLCLGVVAFWLATTGWLVWTELRDEFDTAEPPPYVIDPTDEVEAVHGRIRWLVWVGDEPPESGTFPATTWMEYREKGDDFVLHLLFDPGLSPARKMMVGPVQLRRMESEYCVDRGGRLLSTVVDFQFVAHGMDLSARLSGDVRGDRFHGRLELPELGHDDKLNPVPVSRRACVLLPMHPVNKIKIDKLTPGRTWTMPMVNPLDEAMTGEQSGPRALRARVLPDVHMLEPVARGFAARGRPIRCLVIEYEDPNHQSKVKPRTWVRADNGLVVRQESELFGDRVVMQRDSPEP